VLSISEDAYQGDAQFTVSLDGKQLGGTFTTTALQAAGVSQNFTFRGDWAIGAHAVAVNFLNDAWGGTAATDRNLYVNAISYDGTATGQSAELAIPGPQSFSVTDTTAVPGAASGGTVIGSGSDNIVLTMSEDADGPAGAAGRDAQFTINVDGRQIGGLQSVTASHAAGETQTFTVKGDFALGQHAIAVTFANNSMTQGDKAAFDDGGDRNLYVNSVTYDGQALISATTPIYTSPMTPPNLVPYDPGNAVFLAQDTTAIPIGATPQPTATPAAVTVGSGPEQFLLMMSEDPFQGDAQFTVSVDGQQIGGTLTTTAVSWQGQQQAFVVQGAFGTGAHTVSVNFLNDTSVLNSAGWAYDAQDRNLYVNSITYNNVQVPGAPYELGVNGSQSFSVPATTAVGITLTGTTGNDTLTGGAGNDILNGRAGSDTMIGGAGNDTYFVDNVADVVRENAGGGTDTILAGVNYTLAAGSEIEFLRGNAGATGLTLTGNEFANTVVGNTGNDTLNGGAGNDILNGNAGADTMAGGTGNDTYLVDNALDVVTEKAGEGTDTVFASTNYSLGAGSEIEFLRGNAGATGLTLTGNEFANTVVGNTGNDILTGGAGNDILNGNAGNDVLDGGAGNDTLIGGAGTDIFKFLAGSGHDIITDFQSSPLGGQDLLDISGLGITSAAFAGSVTIAAAGANTLIAIGANTIQLNGVGAGTINSSDFMFAH
jgi:Ca2+-binding RTX toxin-like protein